MLRPRPYQLEGIRFLQDKQRAMLTDAPGLGKTLQASEAAVRPVLVAAPTYLTEQWYDFLTEQYPNDRVLLSEGVSRDRQDILKIPAQWYIINIEMLRTYVMPKVETFIIDESHHVRGRDSQQARGALAVAMLTPRVYLLSATPIIKEPDDLFMQLRLIDGPNFKSYYVFIDKYCKTLNTPWGTKVMGAKNPLEVRLLLRRYALGRSYKEVGLQLPKLIEQNIVVTPTADFKRKYKEVKEGYSFEDMELTSLQQAYQVLRHMTLCKEKLQVLDSLIQDVAHNENVVIFCWYRVTAKALGEHLKAAVVTGEVASNERRVLAKSSRITVATIASMSEGVDLSRARVVIFFEEDYTPGIMKQALSRVHRYSEDDTPIRAYTIYMKGTVDEVVHNAVLRRRTSIREIMREALR